MVILLMFNATNDILLMQGLHLLLPRHVASDLSQFVLYPP